MMARTNITPVESPGYYSDAGEEVTFAAGDDTDGNEFTATGRELIIITNSGAGAQTATIHSAPDKYGREGDIEESIDAGEYYIFGPFPVAGWQQSDGKMYIDVDSSDLEIAVIQLRR